MITLHITRGNDPRGVFLRLPASPDEECRAFAMLDRISTDVSSTRLAGVTCRSTNLHLYIRSADINTDYDKLKRLAEQLDGMTEQERHIFSGALDAESINGLDDVLRIADHLEDYELIGDVICDRDLGGWLVEHDLLGVSFPEAVRPYLDYVAIGAEYYSSHGGAYTMHGYVKRREPAPELGAEEKSVLRLTLTSSKNTLTLGLPASDEQLEAAKRALGVEDFAQAVIHGIEYAADYQTAMIPQDCITVEDANTLSLCLCQMSTDKLMTYRAALEAEDPATFTEALDIAMDIDDYELVSGSEGEYGRQALRGIGANDELLDVIEGYTNFDWLGRDRMEEDGVRQTGCGLVRRLSAPFPPAQELGQTMM